MRPDLPDDGVYLSWPETGEHWIHGDDRELASRWIPSSRVFHRVLWDGDYYHLYYGHELIRVRPSMWLRVHQNFCLSEISSKSCPFPLERTAHRSRCRKALFSIGAQDRILAAASRAKTPYPFRFQRSPVVDSSSIDSRRILSPSSPQTR